MKTMVGCTKITKQKEHIMVTIYVDIQKTKTRLIKKVKTKGLYENFGQKESRKLRDKWGFDCLTNYEWRKALNEFDEWIMNYEG